MVYPGSRVCPRRGGTQETYFNKGFTKAISTLIQIIHETLDLIIDESERNCKYKMYYRKVANNWEHIIRGVSESRARVGRNRWF